MDTAALTDSAPDPRSTSTVNRPVAPAPLRLRVIRAVDSRPPARTWSQTVLSAEPLQPSLLALEAEPDPAPGPNAGAPVLVDHPWTATPSADLPDAAAWSGQLARILVETLHGQRPVGQLTRWVDERVLASVTVLLRARAARTLRAAPTLGTPTAGTSTPRTTSGDPGRRPPVLQSVRVQCSSPQVLEVSVHVRVGHRSEAVAFRLQGWCERWLCTALEIGPRHSRGVEGA